MTWREIIHAAAADLDAEFGEGTATELWQRFLAIVLIIALVINDHLLLRIWAGG